MNDILSNILKALIGFMVSFTIIFFVCILFGITRENSLVISTVLIVLFIMSYFSGDYNSDSNEEYPSDNSDYGNGYQKYVITYKMKGFTVSRKMVYARSLPEVKMLAAHDPQIEYVMNINMMFNNKYSCS